ncbi:MAG: tyrosine-type recombinase/integrase [Anaerostipes sp.]|nr:tyrosine-type recombinase/integrase [Anaerostipes sp.]MDD4371270.1 tyrosine-type recombinase/integrase [Anaerostipes sp.]
MSIQKRTYKKKNGKVTTRYYANVWNPATLKSVTGKMRDKKKDAVQDEAQIIKEISKGKRHNQKKQTFDQVANLWLESTVNNYEPGTLQTYTYFYTRHIKEVLGTHQIDRISTIKIQGYINTLAKKYSPETVNKCINVMSLVLQFAINTLHLMTYTENPMLGIKRLNVPYTKKRTWTDEQIGMFLTSSTIKQHHYYPMFCVSLLLGVRPTECCGFADDDFIENEHILTLHRNYDRLGNIKDTKTKGSIRGLYLPGMLFDVVKKQTEKKMWLKSYHPDYQHDFLFYTIKGHPVSPNYYSKKFRKALKEYNENEPDQLPMIPLYNLRHSFATNNYEHGESEKVLSDIMGNSPKTFLQTYAHIRSRQSTKAISDYEKSIFKL